MKDLSHNKSHNADTKSKLLTAARKVFFEKGYNFATVDDITKHANLARGTFYIYFKNKEDLFRHIFIEVEEQLYKQASSPHKGSVYQKIYSANRKYLEKYSEFMDVNKVIPEVCAQNPEFQKEINRTRHRFITRIKNNLIRGMEKGIYRKIDDPTATAFALGSMVERFAYIWFIMGEPMDQEPFSLDKVVASVSDIWYHALVPDSYADEIKKEKN